MLFELSHENTGLKALHFHGKAKQFKLRLPLALSKLSKQSIFKKANARQSRYRHQEYPKCPEGLAWAGWQGHWHI
jgi:hypothetical protein